MEMTVSKIVTKDGKKVAFVRFVDGKASAEWKIPDLSLVANDGFDEEKISLMKVYLRSELKNIMDTAKNINMWDSFMKEKIKV